MLSGKSMKVKNFPVANNHEKMSIAEQLVEVGILEACHPQSR